MRNAKDGPASPHFHAVALRGNTTFARLARAGVSTEMAERANQAPRGDCVAWGLPLDIGRPVLVKDATVRVKLDAVRARWLVFCHTSDVRPIGANRDGVISPMRGEGRLGERAADYCVEYADGSEQRLAIRRRHEVGALARRWGENCFQAVPANKPHPVRPWPDGHITPETWGHLQTAAAAGDGDPWTNWLWAWENPHPRRAIVAIRFEPVSGAVLVSGVSAGNASETPLRWRTRRKATLRLPRGTTFDDAVDRSGATTGLGLDLGQIISAVRRPVYPNARWSRTYNNRVPDLSDREILIEYAAHPDARFHFAGGRTVAVAKVEAATARAPLKPVAPATQQVTVRVVEKGSRRPVTVKLHVHGAAGEYLAPNDRHRIPNPHWFQDYSVDFTHLGIHHTTYIPGETTILLPMGRVYLEVSKGFEVRPVRKTVRVTGGTRRITVEVEKVLPWREKGWVTADTHVHFLSPPSALLEGAGEGVNVVNLLASQWGELMTNVGDFDGKTTFGSRQTGGDGEYLVRVGTENRQHVLGHISLLGYRGPIIAPMTTGGPDESALGDPIAVLLTQWARQCRRQGGLVVIPHFPNPRAEHAATIVGGDADAVEMTAWGNLYGGIDPYSLSDWYRYLNCGYFVAAVGGTDKMAATTAVGAVRTYARIPPGRAFTYDAWKRAVARGETFVTYGPLMELTVDGKPPGARIRMGRTGGTVNVEWHVASVTVPMSRVELVAGGEIRQSVAVRPDEDRGCFTVPVEKSTWLALLVRGHYRDKPEIVAAHSSPVMVELKGLPYDAPADALTILEQIEGALVHLDTAGTRAETAQRKRMRLILTAAHRRLHNRMHRMGRYHEHAATQDHPEHH